MLLTEALLTLHTVVGNVTTKNQQLYLRGRPQILAVLFFVVGGPRIPGEFALVLMNFEWDGAVCSRLAAAARCAG